MPKKSKPIEFSQVFFKYYQQTPKGLRKFTNPIVKRAVRSSEPSVVKANVWIDTNIKANINKYLGGTQKRIENVKSMYKKKK